jgi:hypothetical protein
MHGKEIFWLAVILCAAVSNAVPSHSEHMKSVDFSAVPNPEAWVPGEKSENLVVTKKNWSLYYASPPEGADFDACVYVVAYLGVKPNPGYKIKILQIERRGESVKISLELSQPEPKKAYAQVIVQPIAVVKIPKTGFGPYKQLDFVFVDQKGRQLGLIKAEI